MTNGSRASFLYGAFLLGATLWTGSVRAQAPSFAGSYKAGPMREDYTVESWKPEWCGPAPQSSVANGNTIEIKIEGDELVFGGDKRGFKTSSCYEPLPSLARQTHSKDLARGVWTTHCSTPPQDPRKAVVDTTVTANASSGKIDLVETAKFELVVKEGTCVARLSRRQSFQRVGTVAPPADLPKPVDTRMDCSSPGTIERIEVLPKERSLRAGDTFVFRSSGRDAKGCPVPNSPARFLFVSADPNVNVTVEPGGKVVVAGESKEGHAKLRVEIGGKEALVDITVVSRAQYEDLLRRHEPSVQSEEVTNLVNTSTVQTTPVASSGSRTWMYLAVAGVGFLGIIAAVLLRKRKGAHNTSPGDNVDVIPNGMPGRAQAGAEFSGSAGFTGVGERSSVSKLGSTMVLGAFRDERADGGKAAGESAAANAEEWICPTCLAPREKNATFCSKDGSRVVPASSIDRGAPQHACPVCRRSFGAGVAMCPDHGESLVPIRTVAMPKVDAPKNVTKVCPKCGAKYSANVVYCGVDGETLALLN